MSLSFLHYLTRYRIQQAKHVLAIGEKTITEIALEAGFSGNNYFSRFFGRKLASYRLPTGLRIKARAWSSPCQCRMQFSVQR